MNRVPAVVRVAEGSFAVEGMLLHVPGIWELYLDVAREGISERAQFSVRVEPP